jgi:hypothetical protein
MEVVIILYVILFVASEVVPWFHMRSYGITFSLRTYFLTPLIKKNIFAYWHNRRMFEVLVTIKNNHIDLTLDECSEMYSANVDLENYTNAVVLAKNKNVVTSKDVLKTLAYGSRYKQIIPIIKSKRSGEEVMVEDVYEGMKYKAGTAEQARNIQSIYGQGSP